MSKIEQKSSRFEFVTIAGARARQLLAGSTPKTTGTDKLVRLAQKEVREGKIQKIPTLPE